MGKYFGTDGFRGEANVVLTSEHAFRLGRFLGWYFGEKKREGGFTGYKVKAVIGKDARRSSYMFEYALAAGLTASGADAYLLHVTTTPSVSFVTRSGGFDCGIMISASHNPYYDNGIKLLSAGGEKMPDSVLDAAEAYLDGHLTLFGRPWNDLPPATRADIGRTVDYTAGRNRYIGYLISLAAFSLRGKRVGLDCANGSAWSIAGAVYDALGAKTVLLHAQPNGLNINEDAGSTHISHLQRLVREEKLDVGFAFDGDADRCIAVDETGEVVDGDGILYICGKYLRECGELNANTVVGTVMTNGGLRRAFDREGISFAETPVGDKYVYEYMAGHGCSLGGEQSGHIIFSKYACTGDGILTSLKVMEVMLAKKQGLHALTAPFVRLPQRLLNIRVRDPQGAVCDPALMAAVDTCRRELDGHGRVLVRASGTEPMVRILCEAESDDCCVAWTETIAAVLRAGGYEEE